MSITKTPLSTRWSLSNYFRYSEPITDKPRGVAVPKVKHKQPLILFDNKELLKLNENDYEITFSNDLEECLSKVIPINRFSDKVDTHNVHYHNNTLELYPKKIPILRQELPTIEEYADVTKEYKKLKYNNSYRLEAKAMKENVNTITSQKLLLCEDIVYDFRSKLLRRDPRTAKNIKIEIREKKQLKKWHGKYISNSKLYKSRYNYIYIFKRPFSVKTIAPHIEIEDNKTKTLFKMALESTRIRKKILPDLQTFINEIQNLLKSTKNNKTKVSNRQKRERQYLEILLQYINKQINEK